MMWAFFLIIVCFCIFPVESSIASFTKLAAKLDYPNQLMKKFDEGINLLVIFESAVLEIQVIDDIIIGLAGVVNWLYYLCQFQNIL